MVEQMIVPEAQAIMMIDGMPDLMLCSNGVEGENGFVLHRSLSTACRAAC
jgi:hypothetical protein